MLAGCAATPKLTQEQIFTQYEQIANLDKGLKDAMAKSVINLAPEGFKEAKKSLAEAL